MERFGISAGGQLLETLRFGGVGVLLAAVYGLFRLWRLLFSPGPVRLFWQDILYAMIAALFTQAAALPITGGRVRGIHVLSMAVGFAAWHLTAGRLFHRLAAGIIGQIRRLFRRFNRLFARLWQPLEEKRQNLMKKAKVFCKKHLRFPMHL